MVLFLVAINFRLNGRCEFCSSSSSRRRRGDSFMWRFGGSLRLSWAWDLQWRSSSNPTTTNPLQPPIGRLIKKERKKSPYSSRHIPKKKGKKERSQLRSYRRGEKKKNKMIFHCEINCTNTGSSPFDPSLPPAPRSFIFLNEKQVTKLCPNFSPDIIIGLYLLYFGSVSSGTDLIVILKFIHW